MSRDTEWKPKGRKFKLTKEQVAKRNRSRWAKNPDWFSDEAKDKLREAQVGRKYDKLAKYNMSIGQFRRWYGQEFAKKAKEINPPPKKPKSKPLTLKQREERSYRMKIWWEKKRERDAKAERDALMPPKLQEGLKSAGSDDESE